MNYFLFFTGTTILFGLIWWYICATVAGQKNDEHEEWSYLDWFTVWLFWVFISDLFILGILLVVLAFQNLK